MNISVHLQPINYVVRFYSDGKTYEARDEFDGVLTLSIFNNQAIINGMHGDITKKHYELMLEQLKSMGIEEIISERHGKLKTYRIEKYLDMLKRYG